ncbi:flagellar hook protein FlgE [Fundidesulfovibrio terrae]|uniref:flagellar hook protein FlgE n=1 Tax=Fundidesulfovibrio terrae TaxID=2922866 RepID=UPI001FB003A8|nr:flagellar hook protein FlgE [Fundidesulfovibrio terrae]
MGLSTSMWSGVTGLLAHGDKMGIIGNNLANVNTIGYKSARMDFEDLLYTNIGTGSGTSQLGQGVRTEAILSDFTQGGFQTSNETTDMAISGSGFFTVHDRGNQATYYTRAGNFRFDNNGYLVDPNNYAVQGWQVDSASLRAERANGQTITRVPTKGAVTDVRLDTLALAAQPTNTVTLISNLDPSTASKSTSSTNPFFSLFQNYNYNPARPSDNPLPDTSFGFQNTLKVYDQRGGSHDLTVYYDKVSDVGGKEYWEYMVTCNPQEDGRQFTIGGVQQNMASNSKAGVLMLGTMVFNDSGVLQNQTSYTLNSNTLANPVSNLSDWTLAKISGSGYPVFTGNFRSVSGASTTTASNAVSMSLSFGLRSANTTWNTTATDASMIGLSHLSNASVLQGFDPSTDVLNNLHTTNFAAASSPLFISQDGYPPGTLQGVSVSSDGVLTGRYSNGQTQELYVISLADFASPWGLKRDGGNLFSQTRESGDAVVGRANTGRLGSIASNSLETSNVDMAREMVEMIQTQRGFQANSKIITTADTMLSEVIQLKR